MPRRPDMPPLRREDLDPDPIAQFAAWFAVAARGTAARSDDVGNRGRGGEPDARMVLLKGVDVEGFRFFTNYESAKGAQLESGTGAALVVYWRELDRQVRVRGTVERLGAAESDAYFATRSRDSQLGAWASPQSQALESREGLDDLVREAEARFGEGEVLGRPTGAAISRDRGRSSSGRPGRSPARSLPLRPRRRRVDDRAPAP